MTFGDGSNLGATVSVSSGDVVTFKDGKIRFANGATLTILSTDSIATTSRGILKSAFFNKDRSGLSVTDIKIVNPESYSPGWLNLTGKEEDEKALDQYGNIVEKVLASEAAEKARRAKINSNYEQAKVDYDKNRVDAAYEKYEEYCKKYGRDIIDRTVNGDIVVGAPWELTAEVIKRLSLYNYRKSADISGYTRYDVYYILREPNKWNNYYRVWVNNATGLISNWYESQYFYRP